MNIKTFLWNILRYKKLTVIMRVLHLYTIDHKLISYHNRIYANRIDYSCRCLSYAYGSGIIIVMLVYGLVPRSGPVFNVAWLNRVLSILAWIITWVWSLTIDIIHMFICHPKLELGRIPNKYYSSTIIK